MPRRDDVYYKAYPGLFLTSSVRTSLTRSQWAAYRDLIDLLRLNGGRVADDRAYLRHNLMVSDGDLTALLACRHVYVEDGHVRHRVVDDLLDDLDSARAWGAEMAAKRYEKRDSHKPKGHKAQRTAMRDAMRDAKAPMGHTQSVSQSKTDRQSAGVVDAAPRPAGAVASTTPPPPVNQPLTPEQRAAALAMIISPDDPPKPPRKNDPLPAVPKVGR